MVEVTGDEWRAMSEIDPGLMELLGLQSDQESLVGRRTEILRAVLGAIAEAIGTERQTEEWSRYLVLSGGVVPRDGEVMVELTVWLVNRNLLLTSRVELWTDEMLYVMENRSNDEGQVPELPLWDIDTDIMETSDTFPSEQAVLAAGSRHIRRVPEPPGP